MKSYDKDYQQFRATLEDTIKHQEKLLDELDDLIAKNIFIDNAERRKEFFRLLGRATFGLGSRPVKIHLKEDKHVISVSNLEQFIGVLLYHTSNTVSGDFFYKLIGDEKKYNVEIKELWEQIRIHILGVFPEAKINAIRMSKEREKRDESIGASIENV